MFAFRSVRLLAATCAGFALPFLSAVASAQNAAGAPPTASASAPASAIPTPSSLPSASPLPTAAPPPAGIVPSDVSVELGGTVSPQFALAQIGAAIARQAQLQSGAAPNVTGVSIPHPLHAGDALEALARVTISAGASYAPVAGTTAVHLQVETLTQLEPACLFYSDDPERLVAADDGVLYRNSIAANQPVRLYAYHVSDTAGRRLYLALRATNAADVQLLGYAAGPADAFAYVGHVSTLQYLLERATQESLVEPIAAGAAYLQQLGYRALGPGELVAAIFDLRVLDGGPVEVEVIATSADGEPPAFLEQPELPGDGHGRRGEFSLQGVAPIAFDYTAGAPEPAPLPVGRPTLANLRPGGRPLGGDYGVVRAISLQLSNPADAPQDVYFYEQASGGTVTTTIWFAGDPRPIEVPCIRDAANRYLIKAITLDGGQSRVVGGEYMTDGSSSFPLLFGLTSDAPSPPPGPYSPDACNPRTPPPATPSPAPSPTASAAPLAPETSPAAPVPPAPTP